MLLGLVFILSACTLPSPNPRPDTPPPTRYSVTVVSNQIDAGLITVSPQGPYLAGTSVTFTAPSLPDYAFVAWHVQNMTYDTPTITLTIEQNLTIEAEFRFVEPEDEDPVDPGPVDPDPTEPDPTDPVDPDPTEPDPVDPDPTEPDPTEPDPVDPDPTDPDPVDDALNPDVFTDEVVFGDTPSLRLSSNRQGVTFTLSHESYVLNQNTTIEAPTVEGYRFVYWYDVNFNRIISYDRSINLLMSRNQRLRAVYEEVGVVRLYVENNIELDG